MTSKFIKYKTKENRLTDNQAEGFRRMFKSATENKVF